MQTETKEENISSTDKQKALKNEHTNQCLKYE